MTEQSMNLEDLHASLEKLENDKQNYLKIIEDLENRNLQLLEQNQKLEN